MTDSNTDHADTIVVFTARSRERIIQEGGSQAWVLNATRAKSCSWVVCTQNRHNPDHEFSDATEAHGAGFLVGKIANIEKSQEEGAGDRWIIRVKEVARVNLPNAWDGGRNPVRYTTLAALGIKPEKLKFEAVVQAERRSPVGRAAGTELTATALTIAEAKKALAATYGVKPEAIEITIRG